MRKMLNNERGITLIALIIAIIILILLAAISIRTLYDMDIVWHAVNGTEKYIKAAEKENKILNEIENTIEQIVKKIDETPKKTRAPGIYEMGTDNLIISWEDLKDEEKVSDFYEQYNVSIECEFYENGMFEFEYFTDDECDDKYKNIDFIISDEVAILSEIWMNGTEKVNLYLPDNLIFGEDCNFGDVRGLLNVNIPSAVTHIGDFQFEGCEKLESITIPNSVTSIGKNAFYHCSSLTSVTIPSSVTSIGDYAFGHCWSLTSVTIPNGITSIGAFAFEECRNLTSVTIPNGITSIGDYAFYICESLISVTIPNSVTEMGEFVFEYCENLNKINVRGYTSKPEGWNSNWDVLNIEEPVVRHNVEWNYTGE